MKSQDIQQELLLLTTTHFSQRQRDRSNSSNKVRLLRTSFEELEKVCRNKLFADMSPDALPDDSLEVDYSSGRYFMVKVYVRKATAPLQPDEALSINPYLFALHINVN